MEHLAHCRDRTVGALTLEIELFRNWRHLTVTLQPGQVTLLRGASGSGKSTIIAALIWVLYGKERGVTPTNQPKAKTRVQLQLTVTGNRILEIDRRKNPVTVQARYQGADWLTSGAAQALIDSCCGSYANWLACSYLGRACDNAFMTGSAAERLLVLNSLAFLDDDPQALIIKIKEQRQGSATSLTKAQTIYEHELARYQQQAPADLTEVLPAQVTEAQAKLTRLTTYAAKAQRQRQLINETEARRQELQASCARLEAQLPPTPPKRPDLEWLPLDPCACDRNSTCGRDDCVWYLQHLERLRQALTAREQWQRAPVPLPGPSCSEAMMRTRRARLQTIQQQRTVAQKLGVTYDSAAISAELARCREAHRQQELRLVQQRYQQLAPVPVPTVPVAPTELESSAIEAESVQLQTQLALLKTELTQLRDQEAQIRATKTGVACPSCQTALAFTYVQGQVTEALPCEDWPQEQARRLTRVTQTMTTVKAQGRKLEAQLAAQQQKLQREKQAYQTNYKAYRAALTQRDRQLAVNEERQRARAELLAQHPEFDPQVQLDPAPDNASGSNYLRRISELEALQSNADFDFDLSHDETRSQYWAAYHHWQSYGSLTQVIEHRTLPELEQAAAWLRAQRQYVQTEAARLETRARSLKELRSRLAELPQLVTPKHSAATITKQITRVKAELATLREAQHWNAQAAELQTRYTALQELATQHHQESSLYDLAIQTEHELMTQVTTQLNHLLEQFCAELFEDQIQVRLVLSQTAKASGRVHYRPEFDITRNGHGGLNLSSLSGGQKDRVAVAATLALAQLTPSPILLLDESLASLSGQYKQIIVHQLSRYGSCYTLVVMHDGVRGIFDQTIDLDQPTTLTQAGAQWVE